MHRLLVLAFIFSLAPAVAALTEEDRMRRLAQAIREALECAGLPMLKAALHTKTDRGQWTRIVDGQEGSLPKFARLPDVFWQELGPSLAQAFGISRRARAAERLRRLSVPRKRMARMALSRAERRTA